MSLLKALAGMGYDPEKLKKIFEDPTLESTPDTDESEEGSKKLKTKRMIDSQRQFVRDALDANFRDAQYFYAIDRAYDIAQEQCSPTLARCLFGSKDGLPASSEVLSAVKNWNMEKLIEEREINGKKQQVLNLPIFFNIFFSLVASYTKVRWSKLWTDRDVVPLYRYEAAAPTITNNAVCKVITQEIAVQAEAMDYRGIERAILLPMLLYGYAWAFPRCDWFRSYSYWGTGKDDRYLVREGIQWEIVHPTKTLIDRAYPMTSINSDTGMSRMGYWSIVPYSELHGNDKYWNQGKISMQSPNTDLSWSNLAGWRTYQEIYPCTMKFQPATGCCGDRINQREDRWYGDQNMQEGVQIVSLFAKIVPKDCGLYDCPDPIWHRFIYAGDGTVISCVPYPYTPGTVDVYDYDPNRARNSSLSMELLPFQDQIGNMFTQHILSVKSNLTNVIFADEDLLPPSALEMMRNMGKDRYVATNFIPYKGSLLERQGTSVEKAIFPASFPKHNVFETIGAINLMISIMERTLGFSSQEVGSAASHQQSAAEVTIIDSGTGTRTQLTGSFADSGWMARMQAAYDGWMEFSERDINTELTGMSQSQIEALKEVGFSVEKVANTSTVRIKGPKEKAEIFTFAQFRSPKDRSPDAKVAVVMMQAIQAVMSNPTLVQQFGPDVLLKRFNEILDYIGVPGDWRFTSEDAKPQPSSEENIAAQIAENNKVVSEDINATIVPKLQQLDQGQQALAQQGAASAEQSQQLAQAIQVIQALTQNHDQSIAGLAQQIATIMANVQANTLPPQGMIPPPQDVVSMLNPEPVLQPGLMPMA